MNYGWALFWIVAVVFAVLHVIQWLERHDRRIAIELVKLLRMPRKEKRAFIRRFVKAGCRQVVVYFLKSGEIKSLDFESFLHLSQVKDSGYRPSYFVAQIVLERQQRGNTVYAGHSIYYLGCADLSTRWRLEWDTIDLLVSTDSYVSTGRKVLLGDGIDEIEIRTDSQIIEEILNLCSKYSSVADYRMKYFATWAAKKLEDTKTAFKSTNVEKVRLGLENLTSFPLNLPAGCQPDLDEVFKS